MKSEISIHGDERVVLERTKAYKNLSQDKQDLYLEIQKQESGTPSE